MRRAAIAPSPGRSTAGVGNTPYGGLLVPPYVTAFAGGDEDPISEGGLWLNGGVVGGDWGNCAITNGRAHGRHAGIETFGDPTAIIDPAKIPFPADQEAEGVIFGVDAAGGECSTEAEIRLRSALSSGVNRGYEVFWSLRTGNTYIQIARWNGALGAFDLLYNSGNDPSLTPVNGYTLRGRATGSAVVTITWEILNGSGQLLETDSVTDSSAQRWTDGQPGMGFYIGSACFSDLGPEDDFGFDSYSARAA